MKQQPLGKGVPVFAWRESGQPFVGAGKIMVVRKTKLSGNLGHGFVGVCQQKVCLFYFDSQNILL